VVPGRAGGAAVAPAGVPGSAGQRRLARKELVRIERRMERLTAEEGRLHEELTAHASDHEQVQVLDRRLRAVLAERAELEDSWLSLAEEADA
jgi:ABC transport system ATP-binding/permease protein